MRGLSLKPTFITLDCYGTLIDWESGIQAYFQEILKRKGNVVDVEAFWRRWEEIQFGLIQEEFRLYSQVLKESLKQALRDFDLPYVPEDGEAFARTMPTWRPFSDVKLVLEQLKPHYRLAIISNTENSIVRESVRQIGTPFDAVITAEDAKAYKPNLEMFQYALERLNCRPVEVLHVAFGFRYDLIPAKWLGFTTVWVNRKGERSPGIIEVDHEIRDFYDLPTLMSL